MTHRDRWDVVVIGSGLNGLTLANYLVTAGLEVLVLERRLESGGSLATEEPTLTGYWANTGHYVFDTLGLLPFHRALALDDVNVRFLHPEVQSALPLGDGRALVIYRDLEPTLESLAGFSPRDAEAWRRFHRMGAAMPEPGPTPRRGGRATTVDRELGRLRQMSPRDVVDESFESEPVKALVLHHLLIPRGIGLDDSGTGHFVAFAIARAGDGQLVQGGSHQLAQGLWTALLKRGSDVWDLSEVRGILLEQGRAVGVELADGRRLRARAVVSTAAPRETFRLAGERHVDPDLLARLDRLRPDGLSVFAVHLALREPPRFQAAARHRDVDRTFRYAVGLERVEEHGALWEEVRRGSLPTQAAMFVSIPSAHDPSQAPPGHHTALLWHYVPRALRGCRWAEVREAFMTSCVDRLRRYAPNVGPEAIVGAAAMTPDDHVAKFPDLAAGLFGGRSGGGQLGPFRPLPELAGFRTPIPGLYLAGAGLPPGAGLSPAPALGCLEVLAADLGIARWWAGS